MSSATKREKNFLPSIAIYIEINNYVTTQTTSVSIISHRHPSELAGLQSKSLWPIGMVFSTKVAALVGDQWEMMKTLMKEMFGV